MLFSHCKRGKWPVISIAFALRKGEEVRSKSSTVIALNILCALNLNNYAVAVIVKTSYLSLLMYKAKA